MDGTLLPTANTFFLTDESGSGGVALAEADVGKPWLILARALLSARAGDFRPMGTLEPATQDCPTANFANACTILLGFAAPRHLLARIAAPEVLQGPRTAGLPAAYRLRALTLTHALWAARHVLQQIGSVPGISDRRELIQRCSRIIDPAEPFFDEDEALLQNEARRLTDAAAELISANGSDAIACLHGSKLNIPSVIDRMLAIINSPSVTDFAHYRMIFEACTGQDCRRFYRDHHLQKLAAAAVIEEFLESLKMDRYTMGVRYFFGRPIPD
jgi:hypothetical protein